MQRASIFEWLGQSLCGNLVVDDVDVLCGEAAVAEVRRHVLSHNVKRKQMEKEPDGGNCLRGHMQRVNSLKV